MERAKGLRDRILVLFHNEVGGYIVYANFHVSDGLNFLYTASTSGFIDDLLARNEDNLLLTGNDVLLEDVLCSLDQIQSEVTVL